ncbi:hypothetical protein BF29_3345 [Heyndrickxia coagulans DSM 1 = ATCC 7050]|uniref:Uncharacterized protein n=1 Tax=Heyndrickxia coagulans DSM 1 = ATCC 7050 TaxID=1121088 RepID=A0A8B4BT90_HEYCO|nr:hypothetical protein BF29_3345 [Heyndrickxia coagulans DSM 1 = ATCC 7050]SHE53662.1 hypothetical protein SAMN02745208_00480 [Heyndrickxia coagulans DSM 1 = ATCC 7050]
MMKKNRETLRISASRFPVRGVLIYCPALVFFGNAAWTINAMTERTSDITAIVFMLYSEFDMALPT